MFREQTLRIKSSGALVGMLVALGLSSGCTTLGAGQKCGSAGCNADARTTTAIQSSLDRHPELGPSGQLQVATLNRVVYLYGSVANDLQLAVANSVASNASGEAKIVSSIAVSEK
jgi:osmotically-inducible protein OsmY